MKRYTGIVATIIVALVSTSVAMNKDKKSIRRSAERLLSSRRCSSPDKEQKKLMDTFRNYDSIEGEILYPDDLNVVVSAVSIQNSSLINTHSETLHHANDYFFQVPGYINFLKRLFSCQNEAHIRGALFEVQLALAIHTHESDEVILEFGKTIPKPNNQPKTEIDLVTNKRWIECKSRSLETKNVSKLKTQLIAQKKLADEKEVRYEVHFKLPINEQFARWMKSHEIEFAAPLE